MPTNVDFFRAFAADTTLAKNAAYYFAHDTPLLSGGSHWSEYSSAYTRYMFHYTSPKSDVIHNKSGNVHSVIYKGAVLILEWSPLDRTVDGQRGDGSSAGSYEQIVKGMINNGGVIREIADFHNKSPTYQPCNPFEIGTNRVGGWQEVHSIDHEDAAIGAFVGSGIWVWYEMTIQHPTFYSP